MTSSEHPNSRYEIGLFFKNDERPNDNLMQALAAVLSLQEELRTKGVVQRCFTRRIR